jgi:hypothetical protein
MTPEEVRRIRQMEIERGGMINGPSASVPKMKTPVEEDEEEKIVMSSSSYPGQEWQPDYGNWAAD